MTKRPCSPAESVRESKRLKSQTKHSRHASEPVLACPSASSHRQNSAPPTASSVPRPKANAYTILMASNGQPTTKGKPVFRSQKVFFTPARPKPVRNRMRAREKPAVPLRPPPLIQDDPEDVSMDIGPSPAVQRLTETRMTVQPLETTQTQAPSVQPLMQSPSEEEQRPVRPSEITQSQQQLSEALKTVQPSEITQLSAQPSMQPPSGEEQRPVNRLPRPVTRLPSPVKRLTRSASLKRCAEDTPNSTLRKPIQYFLARSHTFCSAETFTE